MQKQWTLLDYQEEAKRKAMHALKEKNRALVVMASGLGKTVVAGFCVKELLRRGRGLFLCHELGILKQAMAVFRSILGPDKTLAPFHGSEKTSEEVDVLFATFQTMRAWAEYFPIDYFNFIVVDESHHSKAPTYDNVIESFKTRALLGITATPDREDEQDIRQIFGEEVVNYTLEQGIAYGWLTPVEYWIMNDYLDKKALERLVKESREKKKRITRSMINRSVFIKRRDDEIARIITEHKQKAIIFCSTIQHANHFVNFLPDARVYHSGCKEADNEETLEAFKAGKIRYLVAVNKLNEGVDIPEVELIVFLRATRSRTVLLQQLGRGLRKFPGKRKVTVLDFVANCQRLEMVHDILERERSLLQFCRQWREEKMGSVLHVEGKTFDFVFSEEQVHILSMLQRIKRNFYPTWQEAGGAARELACWTAEDYRDNYWKDPRLPSHPNIRYPDFPGWPRFLFPDHSAESVHYYPTWEEAGVAARALGVKNPTHYTDIYRNDPQLPSTPAKFYLDFPGWPQFLGRKDARGYRSRPNTYKTWQEAARAIKRLGISTVREYHARYKEDIHLPYHLEKVYQDYPGWEAMIKSIY